MSSSSGSTVDQSTHQSWGYCDSWGRLGNWSGMNIAAMVLGFVFFWPVGLVILYWIIRGRHVQDLPQALRRKWSKVRGKRHGRYSEHSDNTVFNAYQQTQHDRISEIKEEIKERSQRFKAYRDDAKRRADEEEFNRFMSDMPMPDGN